MSCHQSWLSSCSGSRSIASGAACDCDSLEEEAPAMLLIAAQTCSRSVRKSRRRAGSRVEECRSGSFFRRAGGGGRREGSIARSVRRRRDWRRVLRARGEGQLGVPGTHERVDVLEKLHIS